MRASRALVWVLFAAIAVASGTRVSAHRLDEFLQAARIALERNRVQLELSLTPGTDVAAGVIREIDTDRDGVLSEKEEQIYAGRVLSALTLRVDASPLRIRIAGKQFPDPVALRAGEGTIIMRLEADASHLSPGPHRLFFRNTHAAGNSVYLANALVPEDDDVAVTRQLRRGDQSDLTIEFAVRAAPSAGLR